MFATVTACGLSAETDCLDEFSLMGDFRSNGLRLLQARLPFARRLQGFD